MAVQRHHDGFLKRIRPALEDGIFPANKERTVEATLRPEMALVHQLRTTVTPISSRRRDGLTPHIRTAPRPHYERRRARPRLTNVRRSLIRRPLDKDASQKPTERASETSSTPTMNPRRSTTSFPRRGRRGHLRRSSIRTRRPRRCPTSTPSTLHRRIIVAACLYTSICRNPKAKPLSVLLRRPGEWAPEAASKAANSTHQHSPPRLTAAGRNRTCGVKTVQVRRTPLRRHCAAPARSLRWPPKYLLFPRCRPNTEPRTQVDTALPPLPPPVTHRRMHGTIPRRLSRKAVMLDHRLPPAPARTIKRHTVIKARRRPLQRTCILAFR